MRADARRDAAQAPGALSTMAVRPGQIAGFATSGVWSPAEHFAFLVMSSQSLRAWPDFEGVLQWMPVNDVAAVMVDLLRLGDKVPPDAYPVSSYRQSRRSAVEGHVTRAS